MSDSPTPVDESTCRPATNSSTPTGGSMLFAFGLAILVIASGFLALDAQAESSPTPAQAMDDHPIYDAIEAEELGQDTLAEMVIQDTDENGATDFLDLWAHKAKANDEGDTPIEVLAWWNGEPTEQDADAFQLATDAHSAQALDLVDAVFATVPSDRAHDGLALEDVELLVWEPRVWTQTHDPSHGEHNRVINADDVHQDGHRGEGSTVAVFDTGIDGQHDAFTNGGQDPCTDKVVHFRNFVPETSDRQPDCGFDDNDAFDGSMIGHGTHVSSTVAGFEEGTFEGVAPEADLVGIKILDDDGGGRISWMENAIQHVIDPNSDAPEVDVVTMSAGAAVPPLGLTPLNGGELDVLGFDGLATTLADNDIPFTSSAGNVFAPEFFVDVAEYPPAGVNGVNQVGSPAFSPDAIAVGSITSFSAKASHSAVGPGPTGAMEDAGGHEAELVKPNVMAMGSNVWGAHAQNEGYHQLTGTSMATPAVAGTLAILYEKNPGMTATEAQSALEDAAQQGRVISHIEETEKPDPDFQYGHGIAQIDASLDLVVSPDLSFENVEASLIRDRSAVVTWETNNAVDSVLEYGTGGTFSHQVSSDELTQEHSIEIQDLDPETTYDVRVSCSDGPGCPATGPTISFTTLSSGQISPQTVDVYAHDVFVREENGDTTFGETPFDMDTRFPAGEPGNERGTFYTFPGPLGPNSWEVILNPGLDKTLSLAQGQTAEATFHLSPSVFGSCIVGCVGALPVNVTVTLYTGDQKIGSGSQEKIIVDNSTDQIDVTTFRVPVEIGTDWAAANEDLRAVYQWETPKDVTLNELIRHHAGENFPIKVQVPLDDPVRVNPVNVTELPSGNHEISADVASAFGSYDLDTSFQDVEIRDDTGSLVDATLVSQPEDYTWVWDNQNDGITSGTFQVKVRAQSIQAVEGAGTTTFLMDTEEVDNVPPQISETLADPDEIKNNDLDATVLSAEVTDGDGTVENVTVNLTELGGPNETKMLDDGSGADAVAGDDNYTVASTVAKTTALGDYSLPVQATDNGSATANASIELTVIDGLAPTAPDPIEVVDLGDGTLFVNWTEATDEPEDGVGVDHYDVYRKAEDEDSFQLIDDDATGTELHDVDVRTEVNYTYRVQAVDANDNVGPAAEATGMPLIRPQLDIQRPTEGETVTDVFEVAGTAQMPDSVGAAAKVPKTLGTDPVGDTDTSEGTTSRGLIDITEVSVSESGDDLVLKATLDELGHATQNGDVFYAAVFNTTDRQVATSTHVEWVAGQPYVDHDLRLQIGDRELVPSETSINQRKDTLTFELSRKAADLALAQQLEDIQIRTYPSADAGVDPIQVSAFTAHDEASGDEPWTYTIATQPANRIGADASGDTFTTSSDVLGLDVWDAGDDVKVRMDLRNTDYIDAVNGETIYGLTFTDAETGAGYNTWATVTWAAGQPVNVEDDPLHVPYSRSPGVLTGSTNELDDASGALTFTISKDTLGLESGIENVAAATWVHAGAVLLIEDKVPDLNDNSGRLFAPSSFAYEFRAEPGQNLTTDDQGDAIATDGLRNDIYDLRNGTIHEAGDDVVVRLSLESLRSAISSNGESIYHVGFDVDGERFTADLRMFWLGSRPVIDPTFSLGGATDTAPTGEVNILNGTVELRFPKTSNGLDPGDEITNVEEATYETSAALDEVDQAPGNGTTVLSSPPPQITVETSLDDGAFQQAQIESLAGDLIQWRQPIDGTQLATGDHTVEAEATDDSGRTSDIEAVTFDLNHAPDTQLIVDPSPTGVGATTTLDATGTSDDTDLVEATIDPGDGTGPVDVTDSLTLDHVYDEPGTYTVTLSARDDDGATTTETTSVSAHTVYNKDQGTWHADIQAAIDQASTDDTILLQPGTYEEAFTAHVAGLTICQANAATDACAVDPDPSDVEVDAPTADTTVAKITASDVTIRGLTLEWMDRLEEDVRGVHVTADGALLEQIDVRLPAEGCDPIDACQGPNTAAVEAGAGTTIRDARLHAQPVDATPGGTWGVLSTTSDRVEVHDSSVRNWTIGVKASAPDTLVQSTTFETDFTGIQLADDDAEIHDSTFTAANSAVYVAGGSSLTQTNVTVRDSDLAATLHPLLFQADKTGAEVDARLNHWGVLGEDAIRETRIEGDDDNDAQVVPYLDSTGEAHPRVAEVHCYTPDDDGGTSLERVARALSLQEAADLDLPSECVSSDDDSDVERAIRLQENNVEPYSGATIDTEVTLFSASPSASLDSALEQTEAGDVPGGATIAADGEGPVLELVAGADESTIDGVTIEAGTSGAAIQAVGLSTETPPAIQDVQILGDVDVSVAGIVAEDGNATTIRNSQLADLDPAVRFTNVTGGEILDNRIRQRADALGETNGVLLDDANGTLVQRNSIHANTRAGSAGIRADASKAPTIEANVVRAAGLGIYVAQTETPEVVDNVVVASTTDQLGDDTYGVSLFQADDAVTENNLIKGVGTGLALTESTSVDSNLDRFLAVATGVDVSALHGGDAGTDLDVHNASLNSTVTPLHLADTTADLFVDARCNDWGAYTRDTIEARIDDDGDDNTVDIDPWTSLDTEDDDVSCLVPPEAQFHVEEPEPPITRLDTVQFNETSEDGSRPITDWRYDFGDGTQHNASATDSEDARNPGHSYDRVGTFDVVLEVEDSDGQRSRAVQAVEIENIPPAVDPIGDIEGHHTEDVAFTASATDAEGDELTFQAHVVDDNDQLQPLPTGATFVDNGDGTASFDWDPAPDQYGDYDIRVTVDDGYDQVTENLTLTVFNQAPVFDPALPDVRGGAVDRNVTLDVNALDPDVEDEVTSLSINVSELPATEDEVWTLGADGTSGRFNWTPESGEEGTYNVTFTAESPGRTTIVTVLLDIRTDNSAPTIDAQASKASFVDGETAKVSLYADDPEGDEVNWSVVTPEAIDDEDTTLTELTDQEADAVWTWEIPVNEVGSHEVTFVADDGYGEIDTNETVVIETSPWVDDRLPIETETGTPTSSPLAGSTVLLSFWAEDPDGALTAADISLELDDGTALTVAELDSEGPLWGAEHEFTSPQQDITATIEITDADGLTATEQVTFDVASNAPPEVTVDPGVVWANATAPNGKAEVELSGAANDPERRQLSDSDYAWVLSGVTIASGPEASVELPLGTHHVDLVVTDPVDDTATGVETLTVHIDDSIEGLGELDAEQTSEGHYRVDQTKAAFERLSGWFNVTDDQANGVASAAVLGTVRYHGTSMNDGAGVTTATFDGQTDPNGVFEFDYEQEILGAEPTSEEFSFLSAPGWHEIELYAASDSRNGAPSEEDGLEETTHTIAYWVEPSQGSTTSLAATSVEGEGACFYDGQGASDSGHVTFDGELETATPELESAMSALEACAGGLTNGELPEGGSYVALTGTAAGGALVVEASTVPATDTVTDGEDIGATGVEGEGACFYEEQGAEGESSVTVGPWHPSESVLGLVLDTATEGAQAPDAAAVADALTACGNALANGELPEGGSYARLSVNVGGSLVTVTVDTVPTTNTIT